ncbi:MAG: hypothetical protein A2534_01540 [Candidatus Magasanikbacteria bacterium RIFOXYD2_FULL_39_9]|nr:MAG: hypothetical protein A2534_01540 [Candidatus Magasanikbacteria bacterium RIFOXYD2_FULL_39_9]
MYQEETNEKVDPDVAGRAARDLGLAEQVEMMEGGEEFDRSQVAGVLERQNWGKIFTGLQEGDRVLSFFVPGADFLSIKNLNDKVFCPQITNKIIVQKRIIIEKEIKKLDKQASILQSDYKIEMVKISKDSQISPDQLEEMSAIVDAAMTKFISEEIVDKLVEEEREKLKPFIIERSEGSIDKNGQEKIKMMEANIDKWDEFKVALQGKAKANFGKSGFRMNYGLATVQGDVAEDKLLAINQSLQTSRMAREKNDSYGAEYSEEMIGPELEKIADLRKEIISAGNKITDTEGNEFDIFLPVPVESAFTRYALNRDLLRDVRKGKFQSADEAMLRKIVLYTKKLNILDAVKPFISEEINTVSAEAEENKALAKKIWNKETEQGEKLEKDEIKKVADILSSEEKDRSYTSKNEFNKRAVALKECAYVSLDVLDLGVDLLLEYESILQDIDKKTGQEKIDEFNKRSLSAGDETTKKLRDFRRDVASICKEFGFADGLVTGEVGGDELTLAVDTSSISEEKLEEFLFALKDKTNTRVIKTVVAKSEKDASSEQDLWKLSELHLQALKRAEDGVAIAKGIEEAERKLNRLFKQQGENAVKEKIASLRGLFILEDGQVKSNAIITEKEGVFKVGQFKINSENKGEEAYARVGYEFDYETISSELNSVLNKK